MKYIIQIGTKKAYGFDWNYYNGNTYYIQDKCFVESFISIDYAKRYDKRKTAEKTADKLRKQCDNVDICIIKEVEE